MTKTTAHRAERIAQARDRIALFFATLPKWDGVPRVDTWLTVYAGAADTPHVRDIGRRWLLGAASRASRPGTPCGPLLVLVGPEGSTLFEGPACVAAAVTSLRDKDFSIWACSALVLEVRDMDPKSIEVSLTANHDRLRPAYGAGFVLFPRTASFVQFSTTPPAPCAQSAVVRTGEIDHEGLIRVSDQLWSEAAHRVASGEGWTP